MSSKSKRYRTSYKRLNNATQHQPQKAPTATKQAPGGSNLTALFSLLSNNTQFAIDGYSNPAAFLGEDSPVFANGTFRRSFLTQNWQLLTTMYRESWLAMRIIDMPCEDMTRSWYRLSADIDEDDINDLKRLEAKHSVKQEIANAIRWGRLYGGAIAVIVTRGDEDNMDIPLDLDSIAPGDFRGLLILDRTQGVEPSIELEGNIDDPDFGLPMYYNVDLSTEGLESMRIHHSRVMRFIGRELPRTEMISESYWGAAELEHIYDELQKRNATSANIAQLVFQANITTLKMGDFGEALALGTDEQRQSVLSAIAEENRFRTSYGLQLLSADDSMENHPYSFTGLSDIYEQFMMDISGAAEIPATKLFGRSPQGFNSTGESDLRNYYETINQYQERVLRPALEKLIPVMALSCWGYIPDDLEFVFEPIAAITPQERADLINKVSDPIIKAFQAHLITRSEAIRELKAAGAEYGVWAMLDDPDDSDPIASLPISSDPDDHSDDPYADEYSPADN